MLDIGVRLELLFGEVAGFRVAPVAALLVCLVVTLDTGHRSARHGIWAVVGIEYAAPQGVPRPDVGIDIAVAVVGRRVDAHLVIVAQSVGYAQLVAARMVMPFDLLAVDIDDIVPARRPVGADPLVEP